MVEFLDSAKRSRHKHAQPQAGLWLPCVFVAASTPYGVTRRQNPQRLEEAGPENPEHRNSNTRTRTMFAVIKTGGKQYRVATDDVIEIGKIKGEPGEIVQLGDVLVVGGDAVTLGAPTVTGASVAAEVLEQGRGPKVIAFKKRRRKNSRRKRGHRQEFTLIRISEILTDGAKPTKTARPKPEPKPKPAVETTDADGDEASPAAPKAKAKSKPKAKKPAKPARKAAAKSKSGGKGKKK
jgi:large subunit ribosomal protein L21